MEKRHTIKIPETYLIIIAGAGNMGDGKVPELMKIWAQKECERLGLDKELKNFQINRLNKLKERMANIIGKESVDNLDGMIKGMVSRLKK